MVETLIRPGSEAAAFQMQPENNGHKRYHSPRDIIMGSMVPGTVTYTVVEELSGKRVAPKKKIKEMVTDLYAESHVRNEDGSYARRFFEDMDFEDKSREEIRVGRSMANHGLIPSMMRDHKV